MASILITSLISGYSGRNQATDLCFCSAGVKKGEWEHFAQSGEVVDLLLCRPDNASDVCSEHGECVWEVCVIRAAKG